MVSATLAGRYRLGDRIAVGGMGAVFEATDERLHRQVAVKLLKEELSADPRFVERFRREARAAAALTHPNIAAVYDYGIDGDRHFIVMELVEGRDLARVLSEEGAIEPGRAAVIGAQIAAALSHAHKAGVVHRDVKPGNVIVAGDDHVKVTDFGIARAAGDSTLTATGTLMGTAQYISPEQAMGQPATAASDIYATGVVLFEMLTGTPPFTGDSPIAVAMKHTSGELQPPSSVNANVPAAFDEVVARATAKDPIARFSDADALEAALLAATTSDQTVAIATTDPLQTVWPIPGDRWHPERIGRIVAIAFLVLGVVAAAAWGYRLTHHAGKATPHHRASARTAPANAASQQTKVTVPDDLSGKTYPDAETELHDLGLNPQQRMEPNDEVDAGIVIGTEPPQGTEVQRGATVTVIVSSGDEKPPGNPHGEPPGQAKKDEKDKEHD